ncbi:DUF2561 family protein [Mycobacterium sp. SMC-4]|uniref:DUF2561 family protein n=1 Tax=Mycobacterium sp. SMC-4 TaxID=2857059 RepID=UPI003CFD051C
MTSLTDSANRSRITFDPFALERNDRLLLVGAAVVWLAALGSAVAATVALVDLGRGHVDSSGDTGTPWVLYVVIAVSAAVIAAAVPLLLRARRATESRPAAPAPPVEEPVSAPVRGAEAPTEKLRVPPATAAAPPRPQASAEPTASRVSPLVDQIWLRCTTSLAGAMGVATLLVGVSTYLMAVGTDVVAWVLYGLAAVVTVAMAAIPWYFLRELGTALES